MWYSFAYATGETSQANGVAIQGDGKIVMAGFTESGNTHKVALMRINPNGSPDSTFNAFVRPGSGQVITDFFGGASVSEARTVAIQPDSKIVVAGTARKSGKNYDFALARYNPDGSLDATFGTGGKVTTDFLGGGDDEANAMALQPDGKIVVAGNVHTASAGYDFGVARYLSNGTLDATFAGGGIESIPFGAGTAEEKANAVTVQADGKIVVAGYAQGYAKDFALVHLNPNGSPDTDLGAGGKITTDFGGADDTAQGVAVQADGNIILAGTAYLGPTRREDFALARYQGSIGVPPGPTRPIPSPYRPKPAPTSTPKANPTPNPAPTATPPATASRYFSATGHTVKGPFLQYWEQHGGLAQQGYPITEVLQEKSDTDGMVYTMQYYERAVFEMHPENSAPNNVLLSLLGGFYYNDKYSGNAPDQHASTTNPRFFPDTGKTIGGTFRTYWETHGGLAQQGYPISNEFQEVSQTDGKTYTVQYFQRAVFEYHPEYAGTKDEVLLSLLGVFYDKKKHP